MFDKQNEDQFIEFLFLQRRSYNAAGNWNRSLWGIAIFSAVIGSNSIFNLSDSLRVLISSTMILFAWIAHNQIKKKIMIGAYTKELFDRSLYAQTIKCNNWEVKPDEIREMAHRLRLKHSKIYNVAFANSGEDKPRGLRDWYARSTKENRNESIFECQMENIWWDKKIATNYKIVVGLLALIVIVGFLLTNYNKSLLDVGLSIFANVALVLKLIDDWLIQKEFSNHHIKIEELIENISEKAKPSIKDLEKMQERILIRRKMRYLPFDFLHKINRFKLHRLWRKTVTYRN